MVGRVPAGQSADDRAEQLRAKARRLDKVANDFERGAAGERVVAAVLDALPPDYVVFHDLRVPSSAANIDHLVVGPSGVWMVDTKNYSAAVTRGRGRGADSLWVANRPLRSKFATVRWLASSAEERIGCPVVPVMCIIAPSLPSSSFEFDGVTVCSPAALPVAVRGAGPVCDTATVSRAVQAVFQTTPAQRPQLTAASSGPSRAVRVPSSSTEDEADDCTNPTTPCCGDCPSMG